MKFFTDKSVKNPYLLIKITDYIKLKNKNIDFSIWKEIFVDPCVYELTKSNEYSWLNTKTNPKQIIDFIQSLPFNHFFSLDYPCDMNIKYQDSFLTKSWNNALLYNNHPNYIITVQSKFNDFWSFVEWFNKYNNLNIKSNILGLGNLCRFRNLTEYLINVLDYAFSNCNHSRIHIYGLCLKAIPLSVRLAELYNIELSIDSTKWSRACNMYLRNKYGLACNSNNRQEFFNEYLKLIEKKLKKFPSIPENFF